jgi:hypothetical protein
VSRIDIFEEKGKTPHMSLKNRIRKKGDVLEKMKFLHFHPLGRIGVNNQNSGKNMVYLKSKKFNLSEKNRRKYIILEKKIKFLLLRHLG